MVPKLGNKHKNASYQTTRSVLGPSLSAQTSKCPIIRARVLDKVSHPGDWFLVKSQSIARTPPPPQGVNIDRCIKGNLRTTTNFTTTTSVDWEKTGTRTSVSAGKRKLKMQLVGRSTTTTTLNVNTNVKLWCSFATKFFAMASFKTMQDLIF